MCADKIIQPFLQVGGQAGADLLQRNGHHVLSFDKALPATGAVAVLHRLRILHVGIDLDVIFIAPFLDFSHLPAVLEAARLFRGVLLYPALQFIGDLDHQRLKLLREVLLDHLRQLPLQRVKALEAVIRAAHQAVPLSTFRGMLLWEGCRSASPARATVCLPSRVTTTVSPGWMSTSGRTKSR